MKKIILPAIILISIVSCNNSQPDKDESIIPKTASLVSKDSSQLTQVTTPGENPASGLSGQVVQSTSVPQQNSLAGKTSAGLNPAHGQPGHRCDITVGAPLNSPAIKPPTPTATFSQPMQAQQKTSMVNPSAAVNPPHGQPGHKCEAGATDNLKTASTQTMAQTAPTLQGLPVMQQTNTITPSVVPSASTGKLNPAHGQPGHDCKVQVGQPLK